MKILGVDPGSSGALALLRGSELIYVEDMPVFRIRRGKSTKAEVDVLGLVDLIERWAPDACFFEQVGGMRGDAPSAAFNFGRAAGAAEAAAKAANVRFVFVAPHVWKRKMGLIKASKDDSRSMASNLWPKQAASFRRKMDEDRAEAALIAEYGRKELLAEGIFG